MPAGQLQLLSPDQIADFLRTGRLNNALADIARLVGAELTICPSDPPAADPPTDHGHTNEWPIRYRGQLVGRMRYQGPDGNGPVERVARAVTQLLEHVVEREAAVSDLADEMMGGYEELNLLYTLLPNIATKVNAHEIGNVIVAETARALMCRRVSLLVLDEREENLKVLAACGVPPEVYSISIPVSRSIAGHALCTEQGFLVANVLDRPDLAALSQGHYETDSFAVVRVPMSAHGKAIGVITATEREDNGEFTARDRKLLEGISALGASALMNCRLHATVGHQMMSTIRALASAVDAKDHYTHDHSGRVARLCVATARQLGIHHPETIREIELAGLLHDIGKIGVPDRILGKKSGLTREEFTTIKSHAQIGAGIVGHVQGLERVAKAILHHHERYDGLGYPSGLAADAIPIGSRLICVCDVFDTLASNRPYRQATTSEKALEELHRSAGTQLDPAVVEAFTAVIAREQHTCAAAPGPTTP